MAEAPSYSSPGHFSMSPLFKLVPAYHSLTTPFVFFICNDLGFSSIYFFIDCFFSTGL